MWKGFYSRHRACLTLTIPAIDSPLGASSIRISAIIDTGFDGFVQVPLEIAHSLGWLGQQTRISKSMVADGNTINIALFESPVIVQSTEVTGICQFPLNQNAPCLIGMDFLRRAKRVLLISKDEIFLIEENKVHFSS